jgi:hypothetical protein
MRRPNGSSPQVECSVAAPRAPRLRQLVRPGSRDAAKIFPKDDVFLRKGIGPAQSTHRDIMRSPAPDPRKCDELLHGGVGVCAGIELQPSRSNLGGKCDYSTSTRVNDSE